MCVVHAHGPLVDLIRTSRSTTVQVKAASALEALAKNNPSSQHIFLDLDAPKALIRLLKVREFISQAQHQLLPVLVTTATIVCIYY